MTIKSLKSENSSSYQAGHLFFRDISCFKQTLQPRDNAEISCTSHLPARRTRRGFLQAPYATRSRSDPRVPPQLIVTASKTNQTCFPACTSFWATRFPQNKHHRFQNKGYFHGGSFHNDVKNGPWDTHRHQNWLFPWPVMERGHRSHGCSKERQRAQCPGQAQIKSLSKAAPAQSIFSLRGVQGGTSPTQDTRFQWKGGDLAHKGLLWAGSHLMVYGKRDLGVNNSLWVGTAPKGCAHLSASCVFSSRFIWRKGEGCVYHDLR